MDGADAEKVEVGVMGREQDGEYVLAKVSTEGTKVAERG